MADSQQNMSIKSEESDKSIDSKRATVTDRLQKRDEERLADLQKRKEVKDSTTASNETLDFFLSKFEVSKNEVDSLLDQSDSVEKAMMSSHFDDIQREYEALQRFVTDNTLYLPAYEITKAQDSVVKLKNTIAEKREQLMPKKKFAFSLKKKASEKDAKVEVKKEEKKKLNVAHTECSFVDLNRQNLCKVGSALQGKDVALARLNDCTVRLKGSPGTLVMDNLTNCTVFCGPVAGSIFIDGCKDCSFILACQQLRIHTTTDSQFYIHVTSKAIIEDCTRVDFAPYNWKYDDLDNHYEVSGLSRSINNWDDVDDFNWLASDKRSPHWNVLAEDKRVSVWNE